MIGVGENNTFGHPNEEVLQRLKNLGTQIYRTDIDGEVSFTFQNNHQFQEKFHMQSYLGTNHQSREKPLLD